MVSSGKWYWEVTVNDYDTRMPIGITDGTGFAGVVTRTTAAPNLSILAPDWGYVVILMNDATFFKIGDVLGFALDMDNKTLTVYANGVSSFIMPLKIGWANIAMPVIWLPGAASPATSVTANFGATPFAYSIPKNFRPYDQSGSAATESNISVGLAINEELQLYAAESLADNANFLWSSNYNHIAAVDSMGRVYGISEGDAIITAAGNPSSSIKIRVEKAALPAVQPVSGVVLNESSKTMVVNETFPLTATVLPDNATNKNVGWASSNTSVATVNTDGLVTAISQGNATITATTEDGGFTAACGVTVAAGSPTMIVDTIVLDDDGDRIVYSGEVMLYPDNQFIGGSQHILRGLGASAKSEFYGSGVRLIGAKSWNLGKMDVHVDGQFVERVDLYSETHLVQQVVFEMSGLENKNHVVEIFYTGEKHNNSGAAYVTLDAIEYDRIINNWVDDSDSAVRLSAGWSPTSGTDFFMNGQHYADDPNAYAEFTFTGTGIKVIAAKSDNLGWMSVYIDGSEYSVIDLYAPKFISQIAVFELSGLSPGEHTIKIMPADNKSASSSAKWITIDAFEHK